MDSNLLWPHCEARNAMKPQAKGQPEGPSPNSDSMSRADNSIAWTISHHCYMTRPIGWQVAQFSFGSLSASTMVIDCECFAVHEEDQFLITKINAHILIFLKEMLVVEIMIFNMCINKKVKLTWVIFTN